MFSLFGQVVGVRKFANGDIEIDFYYDDEVTEYRYSSNSNETTNFPKELAETLSSTLGTNICAEIFFDDEDSPTHIELEECDNEPEDDEEYDEDLVQQES